MKVLICILCVLALAIGITFGLGFLLQLVLNPILAYMGMKAVSTGFCVCFIILAWVLQLIFFS